MTEEDRELDWIKQVETAMKRYWHKLVLLIGAALMLSAMLLGCATQSAEFQPSQLAQAPLPPPAAPTPSGPMSPEELQQLVAPIALYPDSLVGQLLAASTDPAEIVEAHRWMQQNSALTGQPLAQAVDQQSWDPSVKAMTQFPAVLAMMDQNLSWTSSLGAAYSNDPQSVMAAVQALRRRAQQAGNLKSTPQQSVTDEGQTIAIEPASPEVVYVPEYDPWLVYGAPVAIYPGWIGAPGIFLDAPGVYFGLGIGIGYFAGFGWGWHHWGTDWNHHRVWHDHHPYVSRSRTFRGFDHGHDAFGHGGFTPRPGQPGVRSGAFGGFNHGGVVGAYSARGQTSLSGGFHAAGVHAGGFHGGGFHGGGVHGGRR